MRDAPAAAPIGGAELAPWNVARALKRGAELLLDKLPGVHSGGAAPVNGWRRGMWSSVAISGYQRLSVVISGHQRSSVVISGHQWSSMVINGHQLHSPERVQVLPTRRSELIREVIRQDGRHFRRSQ